MAEATPSPVVATDTTTAQGTFIAAAAATPEEPAFVNWDEVNLPVVDGTSVWERRKDPKTDRVSAPCPINCLLCANGICLHVLGILFESCKQVDTVATSTRPLHNQGQEEVKEYERQQ